MSYDSLGGIIVSGVASVKSISKIHTYIYRSYSYIHRNCYIQFIRGGLCQRCCIRHAHPRNPYTSIYMYIIYIHTYIHTNTYNSSGGVIISGIASGMSIPKIHTQICMCISYIYVDTYRSKMYDSSSEILRRMTVSHCNTLQHTATHCNTLQHTATHCNTLVIVSDTASDDCNTLQHTALHCNTLQHTATR